MGIAQDIFNPPALGGFLYRKDFMPALPNPGFSPELHAALQGRMAGTPEPALNQVSGGMPQGAAMPPAPMPPTPSQMTSALPPGMNQSSGGQTQPPSSEAEMLIKALAQSDKLPTKALADRLKFLSTPPSLPGAPTDVPMGGGNPFTGGGQGGMSSAVNSGGGNPYQGLAQLYTQFMSQYPGSGQ